MENSKINWTDHTWNPWVGCRHVSTECDHCYADFLVSKRMGKDFTTAWKTKTWRDPIKWNAKAPELQQELGRRVRVFCASLTDFFLAEVDEWRPAAWDIIRQCANLDWLILTKRPALAWDYMRRPLFVSTGRRVAEHSGSATIHLSRTVAGVLGGHRPDRSSLAHRGRRVRLRFPTHEG
jgi:protein gp37